MTLTEWLTKCGMVDIKPVHVMIEGKSYYGACYTYVGRYTLEMQAVQRGDKKVDETYTRTRMYLLGQLPPCFGKARDGGQVKNMIKVCFPHEGSDWHLISYGHNLTVKTNPLAYPFGDYFQLSPWTTPNSKIDDGEKKPYKRVPMTVQYQIQITCQQQ